MTVLTEIAHGFRRNLLLIGGCYGLAEGCALATGAPSVPGDLAGIAVGAALSVLAYPSVHEPLLRRVTRRPRTTMAPEDWRQLREMEAELGWELSEIPASAPEPVRCEPPVPATGSSLACECGKCEGSHEGPAMRWFRDTRRAGNALSGSGFLSAPMTGPGGRWRPLSELPGVKTDGGILAEPLVENMRRELEVPAPGYAKARSDREIAAARAAIHFAALARVGLGSCISCCPICDKRWIEDERWGG